MVTLHTGTEMPASREGREYLAAMAAAANFAWASRQAIAHRVREAIAQVLGEEAAAGTRQVSDVAHNVFRPIAIRSAEHFSLARRISSAGSPTRSSVSIATPVLPSSARASATSSWWAFALSRGQAKRRSSWQSASRRCRRARRRQRW
jgi:hypothetical protein